MSHPAPAAPARLERRQVQDDVLDLALVGRLTTDSVADAWRRGLDWIHEARAATVRLDAGGIEFCDGAGAAMIVGFDHAQQEHGGTLEVVDFPEAFQPILDLLRTDLRPRQMPLPTPPWHSFAEEVGRKTVHIWRDLAYLLSAVGEICVALVWAACHPHRLRWRDGLRAMQTAGVDAFPVVMLISTLLGLILAYQSADTLHQFGADIFLPYGLALSLVRELGPLMTAIVMTARSGSAFAAELGTMQVNEEIDALTTMGLDPVRFLVVPRIVAAVLVVPVLTIFANFAGLVGGAVVACTTLNLPLITYNNQVLAAIDTGDVLGGLFKALVFGILAAGVGCIRGMQTRGGATAVGASTTSAVVSGIVLIALADAALAVLFYNLGI